MIAADILKIMFTGLKLLKAAVNNQKRDRGQADVGGFFAFFALKFFREREISH